MCIPGFEDLLHRNDRLIDPKKSLHTKGYDLFDLLDAALTAEPDGIQPFMFWYGLLSFVMEPLITFGAPLLGLPTTLRSDQ